LRTIGGYASAAYAAAFSAWGRPSALPGCGGFLIERTLPDGRYKDATGCYPTFSCSDWNRLGEDVAKLSADLVSVTLVSDALAAITEAGLKAIFPWLQPLDNHYLVDLQVPLARRLSRHHRRKLGQAKTQGLHIGVEEDTNGFLQRWMDLYGHLADKRGITGLRLLTAPVLEAQLRVPGTLIISAERQGELLGADWYYLDGGRVYAHLSAYSEAGYGCAISYPMMEYALEHFRESCEVLDLGGVPGGGGADSGLRYFKSGWSTHCLPSYVCGKVLNPEAYRELTAGRPQAEYFPLYRLGEYD